MNRHPNEKKYNFVIYKKIREFLVDNNDKLNGDLYDLGCGTSPYKSFFLKYAKKYFGVDWQYSPHEFCADIKADLNSRLPLEDCVADTVVSISVLEHLHNPNIMISEGYRILKPDGHLILEVPWQWWLHELPYDYYRFSPHALRSIISKCGFTEIEIKPICGVFTTIALKINYVIVRCYWSNPNIINRLILWLIEPILLFNQLLALFLDKFDRHPELEAAGYLITAKK